MSNVRLDLIQGLMMTLDRWCVGILAVGLGGSAGCMLIGNRSVKEPVGSHSDLRYLDSGWDTNHCGVRHARDGAIKVCVVGAGGSTAVGQSMAITSIKQWLEPLQSSFTGIASSVVMDCTAPHITVNIYGGSIGCFAGPGFVNCGDGNPVGTWLHEFGHAFACLSDTYVNGQAGYCYAGQPKSVMCYGLLLDHITPDDSQGVTAAYNKLFSSAGSNPGSDDDGDGELNGVDRCPNSPAGATVWHGQQNGQWRGCAQGQTPILF